MSCLCLPGLLLVAPGAWAEGEGLTEADGGCEAVESVDRFRYLRQLTLDLWGRVPTVTELEALADEADVPEATIDALIGDEQFFDSFVRRHHQDLLWPNVDALDLVSGAAALLIPSYYYEYDTSLEESRLFLLYVGLYNRGGLVPCRDEPAEFDDYGEPILTEYYDGTMREGYVWVEPYWAPGTQVKVCALEARIVEQAYEGQDCDDFNGLYSGACGCGEMLNRCASLESVEAFRTSFIEQEMRMVDNPIREGRSYFDLLTDQDEELDGPLIHYYRYLAPMAVQPLIYVPPVSVLDLPDDVPFTDTTWNTYPRASQHSGLLTNLLFLLRFQTGRARANRFWDAFLCSPFQAPEAELPSPNEPCSSEPNLRERCGCNGCHAVLEPASAYWARFVESGTLWMDPISFPAYRADCAVCVSQGNCTGLCLQYYVVEANHEKEEQYLGYLQAHMWREPSELQDMMAGPSAMVETYLESGALAECAARKVYERLHGHEMSWDEQTELLPDVLAGFASSGFDFKALVKAWVTSPGYRRMVR